MDIAALLDLDGTVLDTEPQYTALYKSLGEQYCPEIKDFASQVKGRTLANIIETFFPDKGDIVRPKVYEGEANFDFVYIAGAKELLEQLRADGVKMAIVTSSEAAKMEAVYRKLPEFRSYFDAILTPSDFTKSKPDPECFLKAAAMLGVPRERCVVFEDSINGLKAGVRAKMKVVGLYTTNPREIVEQFSDIVVPDLTNFGIDDMKRLLELN